MVTFTSILMKDFKINPHYHRMAYPYPTPSPAQPKLVKSINYLAISKHED